MFPAKLSRKLFANLQIIIQHNRPIRFYDIPQNSSLKNKEKDYELRKL